jgi:hypothetical protein
MQRSRRRSASGQSLAEFAMVFPIFMLVLGGIIQFATILWSQNTLNQVVRDTGRYAASQTLPCATMADQAAARTPIITQANLIADQSFLIGHTPGQWTTTDVIITWVPEGSPAPPCPTANNTQVVWIDLRIEHTVPVFFPWIPGNGDLTANTRFRVEPAP